VRAVSNPAELSTAATSGEVRDDDAFAPKDMRLRGVRVTYFDTGEPARLDTGGPARLDVGGSRAPAVMMLHALGANRARWIPLARALAAKHRVIALDFPGFGDSEHPPTSAGDWTYERLAEVALDLVSALSLGRVALVGHSMGAGAAIVAAADRPEFVERLVLVAPPCTSSRVSIVDRVAGTPIVGRALFRRVLGRTAMHRRSVPKSDWIHASEATWAMLRRAADPATVMARMPRVRTPTLIVWGRDDRVSPCILATRVAREIGGARVEILDCGHAPEVERPDAFAAVVGAFLASMSRDADRPKPSRSPRGRLRRR
jgi:pimeloyl-ACP methyl ester carboxylesterase